MKKIIMTVVAVMAVASMNAEEKAVANKYDMNFNSNSIARYLRMSNDQITDMERVHRNFTRDLERAEKTTDDTKRQKLEKKALIKDMSYMRVILSEGQYKKYRTVLNATMNNRGLDF